MKFLKLWGTWMIIPLVVHNPGDRNPRFVDYPMGFTLEQTNIHVGKPFHHFNS